MSKPGFNNDFFHFINCRSSLNIFTFLFKSTIKRVKWLGFLYLKGFFFEFQIPNYLNN